MFAGEKLWKHPSSKEELERELAAALEVPAPVARVLINRGISTPDKARAFLYPSLEQLHDPMLFKGMPGAVERICSALEKGEKITVYGDYDVDGIASTVLLVSFLRRLEAEVDYYLPNRFQEGYGLQKEPIQEIREKGSSLLITTDCGTNSTEELAFAEELGLDTIITDHHHPLVTPGEPVAVLNPHRGDCPYPWESLSGTGVAFKLVCAIRQHTGEDVDPFDYLDLVALGTVADLVPLLDENRVLTCFGLEKINREPRPGLLSLIKASSIEHKKLGAFELAFMLAPSLNAAGRLGSADPAAELLLSAEEEEARETAEFLRKENLNRRNTEQKILEEARSMVEKDPEAAGRRVIVLASENWHQGVIGIVASRLLDLYYRPVVMVSLEEGTGKGSARSIPGFNITAALQECQSLLERFGGHEQAAGFSVEPENIPALREKLNEIADRWLKEEDLVPRLRLEGELSPSEISLELARYMEMLAPYGVGNPSPCFCSRGWELEDCRLVGRDKKHLKFIISREENRVEPIIFSGEKYYTRMLPGRRLDFAFTVKNGVWDKQPVLNLEVKDLYFSDAAAGGGLEIIDRRESSNRLNYLNRAVHRSGNVIVYAGTSTRKEFIINKFPRVGEEAWRIYTNRVAGEKLKNAEADLFLFHLPMYHDILRKIVDNCNLISTLRVHLLYNGGDREINQKVLEEALPDPVEVEKVYRVLADTAGSGELFNIPEVKKLVREGLKWKSSNYYIKRCLEILQETGLIEASKDGWRIRAGQATDWFAGGTNELAAAESFRDSTQLQEECSSFQEFMLGSSRREILEYIYSLWKG